MFVPQRCSTLVPSSDFNFRQIFPIKNLAVLALLWGSCSFLYFWCPCRWSLTWLNSWAKSSRVCASLRPQSALAASPWPLAPVGVPHSRPRPLAAPSRWIPPSWQPHCPARTRTQTTRTTTWPTRRTGGQGAVGSRSVDDSCSSKPRGRNVRPRRSTGGDEDRISCRKGKSSNAKQLLPSCSASQQLIPSCCYITTALYVQARLLLRWFSTVIF